MSKKKNWFLQKIEAIQKRAKKDRAYKKRMLIVWALLLTIWVGVVFFAVQMIVIGIAQFGIDNLGWRFNVNVAQTVCAAISYALAILIMIAVPMKVLKMTVTRDGLGLRGLPTWTDILLAPIGYILSVLASLAVIFLLQAIAPTINWSETQDIGFNSIITDLDRIVAFIAIVVLAPVLEEVIFRGFLYGKLRTRLSAIPAIILVSVLFGVMHGQWNVGIIVGLMSVFMCIARELTGTIYTGIVMHMLRNGIAFYLLYIASPFGAAGVGATLPMLSAFLL